MANWIKVGRLEDIEPLSARVIRGAEEDIAIFRTRDNQVFALRDKCPHKGGALSQGIVHGNAVTCPLHNWVISLENGEAQGFDTGCTQTYQTRVEDGLVYVTLTKV
ncbi:MAG: nitrite reductase small subunit NirD [Hahellaceae bacterium]|jgi:nitrite reductase (NADH) small subunit|nr:nitrite reductase small subunit NirD [Hahellaceae bacterium]MCP5210869.1 nitrite reductase small subunit NirD [Hahellaceae bacterium]